MVTLTLPFLVLQAGPDPCLLCRAPVTSVFLLLEPLLALQGPSPLLVTV